MRVEFDAKPLDSATTLNLQFRSLDKDWNPVSASKILKWTPE